MMHLIGGTLALAAVAAAQSSSGLFAPSYTVSSSATPSPSASAVAGACAKVAELWDSDYDTVPPKVAYQCLQSVPVAVEENRELIDQLKMMWKWHSETGWLKNPPSTWDRGPLDLIAELDKIQKNLDSFESEYHLQHAIQKLVLNTGNYHMIYTPDILQIFNFGRTVELATVSQDGKTDPKTYVAEDLLALNDDDSINISPVTKINGQDPQKYLERLADWEQYNNVDARYNSLMYRGSGENLSAGAFSESTVYGLYDGPETVIVFNNGTRRSFENTAIVQVKEQDFEGITDGQSLFEKFCRGWITGYKPDSRKSKRELPSNHLSRRQTIPENGYPEPVAKDAQNLVAGYLVDSLNGEALGVLKIVSFEPKKGGHAEFQDTVKTFIAAAKKQGVKKLVLDLRENGGGSVELLLDTFMQLFPTLTPFSAQRFRAQNDYVLVGEATEEIWSNETAVNEFKNGVGRDADLSYWDYDNNLDVNNEPFDGWKEWVGPYTFNDDQVTAPSRYNLSNSNRNSILEGNFNFLNAPAGSSPFTAGQTVMLLDGLCGSSCASIHEELKNIAGVKSVVVGGRARNGPMQAVGGTKGGTIWEFSEIVKTVGAMYNATEEMGIAGYEDLKPYAWPQELMTRLGGESAGQIQIQDQIRKGDSSQTPLQYIYEAADCRLFYTPKTLLEPKAMWDATWAAFTDDSKCVPGSTKHESSISGGYKPFGNGDLHGTMDEQPDDVPLTNGAAVNRPTLMALAAAALCGLLI